MEALFTVDLIPVKRRPRFTSRGGKPRAYMDSKTEAEQRRVLECWKEQTRQEKAPEGIPVSLFVQVFKRTRKTDACDVKPDLDNIVKAIMDALNGYAFEDDKQVVSITARKFKDGSKDGFECVKVKLYW